MLSMIKYPIKVMFLSQQSQPRLKLIKKQATKNEWLIKKMKA